jgi:hypothetical protein
MWGPPCLCPQSFNYKPYEVIVRPSDRDCKVCGWICGALCESTQMAQQVQQIACSCQPGSRQGAKPRWQACHSNAATMPTCGTTTPGRHMCQLTLTWCSESVMISWVAGWRLRRQPHLWLVLRQWRPDP